MEAYAAVPVRTTAARAGAIASQQGGSTKCGMCTKTRCHCSCGECDPSSDSDSDSSSYTRLAIRDGKQSVLGRPVTKTAKVLPETGMQPTDEQLNTWEADIEAASLADYHLRRTDLWQARNGVHADPPQWTLPQPANRTPLRHQTPNEKTTNSRQGKTSPGTKKAIFWNDHRHLQERSQVVLQQGRKRK